MPAGHRALTTVEALRNPFADIELTFRLLQPGAWRAAVTTSSDGDTVVEAFEAPIPLLLRGEVAADQLVRISSRRPGPPVRVNAAALDAGEVFEFGPGTSLHGATTGASYLVISSVTVAAGEHVPAPLPPSVRIVDACESYARRARYQSVTLVDLSRAAGVSERRVRQAFAGCCAVSPTAYLRIAALHDVRHALLTNPPARDAVSRAAVDHGFWHLSRFAGQYRALFGESPRETLATRAGAEVVTGARARA